MSNVDPITTLTDDIWYGTDLLPTWGEPKDGLWPQLPLGDSFSCPTANIGPVDQ